MAGRRASGGALQSACAQQGRGGSGGAAATRAVPFGCCYSCQITGSPDAAHTLARAACAQRASRWGDSPSGPRLCSSRGHAVVRDRSSLMKGSAELQLAQGGRATSVLGLQRSGERRGIVIAM